MTHKQLKELSKKQLKGNLVTIFLSYILIGVASYALQVVLNFSQNTFRWMPLYVITVLIAPIFIAPLTLGFNFLLLKVTNGEKAKISMLLNGFESWLKVAGLTLLMAVLNFILIMIAVFAYIFSISFVILSGSYSIIIIAGVILAIAVIIFLVWIQIIFSQTYFILADNPNLTVIEIIKMSYNMLKGYKFDYVILNLSFIGWALLIVVTLGLASFYVLPYFVLTKANYYNDLIRRYNDKQQMLQSTIEIPIYKTNDVVKEIVVDDVKNIE